MRHEKIITRRAPAQRCFVVKYLGQNKATFECRPLAIANGQSHTFTALVIKKPWRYRGLWLPSPALIDRMVSWWSREKGGVTTSCPECLKLLNAAEITRANTLKFRFRPWR